mmetsp:Transcript_2048/g.5087  ORF Transcript_2048/g.5087 Transcript_2048/m.5087 type:complete len:319 (+) Transcript_2048:1058-2014(+)
MPGRLGDEVVPAAAARRDEEREARDAVIEGHLAPRARGGGGGGISGRGATLCGEEARRPPVASVLGVHAVVAADAAGDLAVRAPAQRLLHLGRARAEGGGHARRRRRPGARPGARPACQQRACSGGVHLVGGDGVQRELEAARAEVRVGIAVHVDEAQVETHRLDGGGVERDAADVLAHAARGEGGEGEQQGVARTGLETGRGQVDRPDGLPHALRGGDGQLEQLAVAAHRDVEAERGAGEAERLWQRRAGGEAAVARADVAVEAEASRARHRERRLRVPTHDHVVDAVPAEGAAVERQCRRGVLLHLMHVRHPALES